MQKTLHVYIAFTTGEYFWYALGLMESFKKHHSDQRYKFHCLGMNLQASEVRALRQRFKNCQLLRQRVPQPISVSRALISIRRVQQLSALLEKRRLDTVIFCDADALFQKSICPTLKKFEGLDLAASLNEGTFLQDRIRLGFMILRSSQVVRRLLRIFCTIANSKRPFWGADQIWFYQAFQRVKNDLKLLNLNRQQFCRPNRENKAVLFQASGDIKNDEYYLSELRNILKIDLLSLRPQSPATTLVVVCHPDDEGIFFGNFLLRNHLCCHLICLTNSDHPTRRIQFEHFVDLAKIYKAEIWGFNDSAFCGFNNRTEIKNRIKHLLSSRLYTRIVTHGPTGEYGHLQHIEAHKIVRAALRELKMDIPLFIPERSRRPLPKKELLLKTSAVLQSYGNAFPEHRQHVEFERLVRCRSQSSAIKND